MRVDDPRTSITRRQNLETYKFLKLSREMPVEFVNSLKPLVGRLDNFLHNEIIHTNHVVSQVPEIMCQKDFDNTVNSLYFFNKSLLVKLKLSFGP